MRIRSWFMVLCMGMLLLAPVRAFSAGPDEMGPPAGTDQMSPPSDKMGPPSEEMNSSRAAHEEEGVKARVGKIFDALGLSAEQKAKLDAGRLKHRDEEKKNREEMRATRELLGQELDKPVLDMTQVKALHEKLNGLTVAAADRRLDAILEVRTILTPEQFAAFQKQMKELHPTRMHREGPGQEKDEEKK